MGTKRRRSTAHIAAGNITGAARNARTAARLAETSASVIAHRLQAPVTAHELFLMVFEKAFAVQTAWWGAGATYASSAPHFARAAAIGRGPFALWEAALATSVHATATVLGAHRAMMTPFLSGVSANIKRLAIRSR